MTTLINALTHFLSKEFISGNCYFCHKSADINLSLCEPCVQSLIVNIPCCSRCANPLKSHQTEHSSKSKNHSIYSSQKSADKSLDETAISSPLCGKCLNHTYYFDQVNSPLLYSGQLTHLMHAFKYQEKLFLGRTLVHLFMLNSRPIWESAHNRPEVLIPIPLYKKRIQERGFNQAIELAQQLGKTININIDHDSLKRIKPTVSQRGLSAVERKKNIKNAFAFDSKVSYKHVALIDDVMTTGNTVNEAAKMLKKAGVERVDVWTIARA